MAAESHKEELLELLTNPFYWRPHSLTQNSPIIIHRIDRSGGEVEVVELSLEEDVREGVGSRIGREGRLAEKRVAQQVLRTRALARIQLTPQTDKEPHNRLTHHHHQDNKRGEKSKKK